MYDNWRFERWQTMLSDAQNLFMESLHDHEGGLELFFADYSNGTATARYRMTFRHYPAYRNMDESFRLKLWEGRDPDATGWTLTVPNSPWILELADSPTFGSLSLGVVHYMILTENDVIEVLSNEAPTVERLAQSEPVASSTKLPRSSVDLHS